MFWLRYSPALPRKSRACVQVSCDGLPLRAVFGPFPGGRQTVGRAERHALLMAMTGVPYLRFVVTDLAALAREVDAWDYSQAASGSEYADIWRSIFELKDGRSDDGRVRPAACWCPAHLDLGKFVAQLGSCAGDFYGNQWALTFSPRLAGDCTGCPPLSWTCTR
ncbi:unnamed protein product [Prorocentrum cordatum]|uniref:Uncharacterized protein n=1 Tax=Prorocentrum cordatum TaxID=2364126 RepID=A0ABN9XIV4_9DINO|nr:unnamed protein product [Polarella glacialis]